MAWILDQTRKLSLNSDNCDYIYVESRTKTIKAAIGDSVKIALGTYSSTEQCLQIINVLNSSLHKYDWIEMPLNGEETIKFTEEYRTFGS